MVRHVLVALDGSDVSRDAFEFALQEYDDARFTLLNVLEAADHVDGDDGFATGVHVDDVRDEVEAWFEEARDLAGEYGVDPATETTTGRADQAIADYAERNDVDLVVMGTHGRTGASRVVQGSVAEGVVRRSPVPVLVYR